MDLVTLLTGCALGIRAELFVPLGALDGCSASFSVGTAVAPQNRSPRMGPLYLRGSPAVQHTCFFCRSYPYHWNTDNPHVDLIVRGADDRGDMLATTSVTPCASERPILIVRPVRPELGECPVPPCSYASCQQPTCTGDWLRL